MRSNVFGKMLSVFSLTGIGLFCLLFLTVGVRSCSGQAWNSGEEIRSYHLLDQDKRLVGVITLPGNKTVLYLSDPRNKTLEAAVTTWKGSYGDHYGFGVWYMDSASVPGPNWRYFPRNFKPVFMEIECLEKFRVGAGEPVFPPEGSQTREFVLFSRSGDRIRYANQDFFEKQAPAELLSTLAGLLDDDEVSAVLRSQARTSFQAADQSEGPLLPVNVSSSQGAKEYIGMLVDRWNSEARADAQPECTELGDAEFCVEVFELEQSEDGLGLIYRRRFTDTLGPDLLDVVVTLGGDGWLEREESCGPFLRRLIDEFGVYVVYEQYDKQEELLYRSRVGSAECEELDDLVEGLP